MKITQSEDTKKYQQLIIKTNKRANYQSETEYKADLNELEELKKRIYSNLRQLTTQKNVVAVDRVVKTMDIKQCYKNADKKYKTLKTEGIKIKKEFLENVKDKKVIAIDKNLLYKIRSKKEEELSADEKAVATKYM